MVTPIAVDESLRPGFLSVERSFPLPPPPEIDQNKCSTASYRIGDSPINPRDDGRSFLEDEEVQDWVNPSVASRFGFFVVLELHQDNERQEK